MQVVAEETEQPQMKICFIDKDATDECRQFLTHTLWEVKFEVSQGICLPDKKKYTVRLQIGSLKLETRKPMQYAEGYCFWNQRFDENTWNSPYHTLEDMGRVYIYLMEGDDPICYW